MRVRLRQATLEAAIARRNLTKTALAQKMGMHRTHLSDILAGRTHPGPKTRQRLLDALGGSFDEFFEIVDGRRQARARLRDLREICEPVR